MHSLNVKKKKKRVYNLHLHMYEKLNAHLSALVKEIAAVWQWELFNICQQYSDQVTRTCSLILIHTWCMFRADNGAQTLTTSLLTWMWCNCMRMLLTLLFAAASVSCSSTLHLCPLSAPSGLWLIRRQTPPTPPPPCADISSDPPICSYIWRRKACTYKWSPML